MTSSQLSNPAAGTAETMPEPDIRALWEPLLQLLNSSPAQVPAKAPVRPVHRPTR
ncbi:hypothetical protein [Actinoplanes sp. CA-252034]|uniref:hypothetical protein n=1 Tax=Actinoplanes sp. CA-252034 TaxID=3239906 RepID=UPI003D97C3FB